MGLFKVFANDKELVIEATTQPVPGKFSTRNVRAKIGDEVTVENGLGLEFKAIRLPLRKHREPNNLLSLIGSAIQDARERRVMTQTELAEKLGTTKDYVSRVERGLHNITLKQLERFTEAIGVREIQIKFK